MRSVCTVFRTYTVKESLVQTQGWVHDLNEALNFGKRAWSLVALTELLVVLRARSDRLDRPAKDI